MADDAAVSAIAVEPIAAAEIKPRFELYTTGEDHLDVMVVNALAGVVVTIAGRTWDPVHGVIVPFVRTVTPPSDRTMSELVIPLAAGFLLDLTAYASSGAPLSGQTYVMLHLVRGLTANATRLSTLAGDYVTSTQCVCWPGSAPKSSTEGEPYLRAIVGTTPAAGAELSEVVPTGARWEIVSFCASLTASAVVGNRFATLFWKVGGVKYGGAMMQAFVVATGTRTITWAPGMTFQPGQTNPDMCVSLPQRLILLAGTTVGTLTNNIDAGDQWTAPAYLVREWLEVP